MLNGISIKRAVFLLVIWLLLLAFTEILVRRTAFNFESASDEHEVLFRRQWIVNHTRWHIVNNPAFHYDPYLGWDTTPGFDGYSPQGDRIKINSRGARSFREYPYKRVPGKKRILFIGDSYAFGEENNNDSITSYFLENSLKNTEFINLGGSGYGHGQMLIKLWKEGRRYKPDAVILLYMNLDDIRDTMKFRDYAKPRFKFSNNRLELTNVPVPEPAEILASEKYHLYTIDLLHYLIDKPFMKNHIAEAAGRIIMEMKQTAENMGAEFYIAAFNRVPLRKDYIQTEDVKIWKFNFKKADSGHFRGHWDRKGHRIFAGFLKDKLLSRGYR